MELIKILGVDPSLRNTGLAVVSLNCETGEKKVECCQLLSNPRKFVGTEAILNMLDMIKGISEDSDYAEVDTVIVESPPTMFNKSWAASTLSMIAHIAGGAVALLGLEKGYLFKPSEWNKTRKKEVTHQKTVEELGEIDTWNLKESIKNEKDLEHILDAASIALWWINENYVEDE